MLIERDGFKVEKTPTLDKHIQFLNNMDMITGLSVNTNLYTGEHQQQQSPLDESLESSEE